MKAMSVMKAIAAGVAGAVTMTALHQGLRGVTRDAPRLDILGMRSLAKSARAFGGEPPRELYNVTLASDVASNGLYFGLAGLFGADDALTAGALLGLAAGAGALLLPGPLGLGEAPTNRTPATQALTVGLYGAGGLVAGAVYRMLENK